MAKAYATTKEPKANKSTHHDQIKSLQKAKY